jgi:hypothetical protein
LPQRADAPAANDIANSIETETRASVSIPHLPTQASPRPISPDQLEPSFPKARNEAVDERVFGLMNACMDAQARTVLLSRS